MKKINYLFFILVSFSGFSQQIDLSLQLDNKTTYYQNMTSKVTAKQTINNEEVITSVEVKNLSAFKFGKENQGILPTEITYKSAEIQMNTQIQGKKIQFGAIEENIKQVAKNITNIPFKADISVKGKILKINHNSDIFDRAMRVFIKKLPKNTFISAMEQKQIQEQVQKSFGAEVLKSNLENILSIFPRNRVAIGDKWEIQTFLVNDLNIKITTTYTLLAVTSDEILIEGKANIHFEKEPIQLEQGQQVFFTASGDISSEIKLDITTKWIKEARYKQQIKGKTEIEGDLTHRVRNSIPFDNSSEVIINNIQNFK